ncbi:hypothetical protein [Kocuria nitroreducens]|uniref:hypothetical protein n=1 Tax=Kocuria nitroreducens TaxID=3058914 RepID=UPI0036DD4470
MDVAPGTLTAFFGPNGAGKSTVVDGLCPILAVGSRVPGPRAAQRATGGMSL